MLTTWKESYDQPRQHTKKQRHYFVNKSLSSQGYGFSSSHVSIWELNYKESWGLKNWCFWTVVLEKTLESPLDCKEIQPVHPKGDQSRVFIGRTDAEAETPILWPPDVKSWLIWKDPDSGRDLGAGGEGDNRGWDGWMASLTRWTWVWVDPRSWWWTGRPGMLRFMGSQRVGHDGAAELNWQPGAQVSLVQKQSSPWYLRRHGQSSGSLTRNGSPERGLRRGWVTCVQRYLCISPIRWDSHLMGAG